MPTPRSGYVYFIGSRQFGWYKIGMSKNAEIRIKNLGILLPFKIEVFAVWSTGDARTLEASMHEKWSASAINGEWFSFSDVDAHRIVYFLDTPIPSVRIFPRSGEESVFSAFSNVDLDRRKPKTKNEIDQISRAISAVLKKFWEINSKAEKTRANKRLAKRCVRRAFEAKFEGRPEDYCEIIPQSCIVRPVQPANAWRGSY